jgi:hypothetical protein
MVRKVKSPDAGEHRDIPVLKPILDTGIPGLLIVFSTSESHGDVLNADSTRESVSSCVDFISKSATVIRRQPVFHAAQKWSWPLLKQPVIVAT